MNWVLILSLWMTSFLAWGVSPLHTGIPRDLPRPLKAALYDVLWSAEKQKVNTRFFSYVYYEKGFCKTCDASTVQLELEKLKKSMLEAGDDLDQLFSLESYSLHLREVTKSSETSVGQDLLSVRLGRSGNEAFNRSVYLNCLDYAKAVAARALYHGMEERDLRFYWTLDKAAYLKMCPARDGQQPIPPRPFVHTLLAFKYEGKWYAMNVEMNLKNPKPEIFYLGKTLPERLAGEYMVAYPAVAAAKPLILAGAYRFRDLLGAIPGQVFINITASGKPSDDPADFKCK